MAGASQRRGPGVGVTRTMMGMAKKAGSAFLMMALLAVSIRAQGESSSVLTKTLDQILGKVRNIELAFCFKLIIIEWHILISKERQRDSILSVEKKNGNHLLSSA